MKKDIVTIKPGNKIDVIIQLDVNTKRPGHLRCQPDDKARFYKLIQPEE
jgi:hypothetical protein